VYTLIGNIVMPCNRMAGSGLFRHTNCCEIEGSLTRYTESQGLN
jgi:hypothetical protein